MSTKIDTKGFNKGVKVKYTETFIQKSLEMLNDPQNIEIYGKELMLKSYEASKQEYIVESSYIDGGMLWINLEGRIFPELPALLIIIK